MDLIHIHHSLKHYGVQLVAVDKSLPEEELLATSKYTFLGFLGSYFMVHIVTHVQDFWE